MKKLKTKLTFCAAFGALLEGGCVRQRSWYEPVYLKMSPDHVIYMHHDVDGGKHFWKPRQHHLLSKGWEVVEVDTSKWIGRELGMLDIHYDEVDKIEPKTAAGALAGAERKGIKWLPEGNLEKRWVVEDYTKPENYLPDIKPDEAEKMKTGGFKDEIEILGFDEETELTPEKEEFLKDYRPTFSWKEAVELMESEANVRRVKWDTGFYLIKCWKPDRFVICHVAGMGDCPKRWTPTDEDALANDWEVADLKGI